MQETTPTAMTKMMNKMQFVKTLPALLMLRVTHAQLGLDMTATSLLLIMDIRLWNRKILKRIVDIHVDSAKKIGK